MIPQALRVVLILIEVVVLFNLLIIVHELGHFLAAKWRGMTTAAFLGKDGGKAKGMCDIELIVPSAVTARVQEGHKVLYHALCEWVDQRVD